MELEYQSISEGYITTAPGDAFQLNNLKLKCGTVIELFLETENKWIMGRVRYNTGYCFFNNNIGDLFLKKA